MTWERTWWAWLGVGAALETAALRADGMPLSRVLNDCLDGPAERIRRVAWIAFCAWAAAHLGRPRGPLE